jgi:hypothetical protein
MLRQAGSQLLAALARQCNAAADGAVPSGVRFMAQFLYAPNGPAVTQVPIEEEWYNRQRNILPLLDCTPSIEPDTWIAHNALVAGDVDIYQKVISLCFACTSWAAAVS